ncbi:hypothetical protein [Bacillus chungangensis]|uniref:Uncharacterized protein n=1 Tax=Bacillus chungangensis TaxID=587633 RepID=A0ABT9WS40_9BACI|nr:hypothetical protein [Bacillus chungangensis]MDQ0176037.1 hypothetical protein [Bacillus chungangensis]
MRVTPVKYCGECHKDFHHTEEVWYAAIENNCFCSSCKEKLDIKDWEPRIVWRSEKDYKQRLDLIGSKGTVMRSFTVIDAHEYESGVVLKVSDVIGGEYWVSEEDVNLF